MKYENLYLIFTHHPADQSYLLDMCLFLDDSTDSWRQDREWNNYSRKLHLYCNLKTKLTMIIIFCTTKKLVFWVYHRWPSIALKKTTGPHLYLNIRYLKITALKHYKNQLPYTSTSHSLLKASKEYSLG